jgi:hypothetical protein
MTPDQPHCRNLLRHAAVPSLGKPGHEWSRLIGFVFR